MAGGLWLGTETRGTFGADRGGSRGLCVQGE